MGVHKAWVHWGRQLPHSILALAVQKDLTFAAVRSDIYVCRRVHWCGALARLRLSSRAWKCSSLQRQCRATLRVAALAGVRPEGWHKCRSRQGQS